jgi:hypothetical protein
MKVLEIAKKKSFNKTKKKLKANLSSMNLVSIKDHYQTWYYQYQGSLSSLVFACITDIDNQGEVPKGRIIDRDNQTSFSLIITDNQAFFTTSLPTFPSLSIIHQTKPMTG